MIIVEGPDGSGKTTLVHELCARLGLEQGQRSTADRDRLHETTVADSYEAVHAAVIGWRPPLIWDRMFYSDPIYAHIVRDEESRFGPRQVEYLHRLVLSMEAPVILCLPDLDVVRENVKKDHQLEGVVDNIDHIWQAYHNLMHRMSGHPGLIVYDYTVKGRIPEIVTQLRDYLDHRNRRSNL